MRTRRTCCTGWASRTSSNIRFVQECFSRFEHMTAIGPVPRLLPQSSNLTTPCCVSIPCWNTPMSPIRSI